MIRRTPHYRTPDGATCPDCGFVCSVVPLMNEFDYAGTHCTFSRGGTHYPDNWGGPVSDCCEADMDVDYEQGWE